MPTRRRFYFGITVCRYGWKLRALFLRLSASPPQIPQVRKLPVGFLSFTIDFHVVIVLRMFRPTSVFLMKKPMKTLRPVRVDDRCLTDMNSLRPISLGSVMHLVDRIHEQYPLVDRTTITYVVKRFLEKFRRDVLSGQTVTSGDVISNARLMQYSRETRRGKQHHLKVKLATPKRLKKNDER